LNDVNFSLGCHFRPKLVKSFCTFKQPYHNMMPGIEWGKKMRDECFKYHQYTIEVDPKWGRAEPCKLLHAFGKSRNKEWQLFWHSNALFIPVRGGYLSNFLQKSNCENVIYSVLQHNKLKLTCLVWVWSTNQNVQREEIILKSSRV